ncbi:hypothetical protein [Peptostreptococcus equinus]|uniref:Uncharacterized protein n=1 Tax=Peptostreptococcus equinus TaxID=3003601 RepID=A0ABY7JPA2_9FIRM|nr:hypothetical protein [Peptostreptococcus sp. CBA3647]WAW15177.1 hypothetical protein O0R46_01640 [Peptostreptococcus sp. CBA3647]
MKKLEENIEKLYKDLFLCESQSMQYLILIGSKVIELNQNNNIIVNIDRLYDEFVYFKYYHREKVNYGIKFFIPLMLVSRNFQAYEYTLIDYLDKYTRFFFIEDKKNTYFLDIMTLDILIRSLIIDRNFMKNSDKYEEFISKLLDKVKEYNPQGISKKDMIHFQLEKIKYIEDIHKIEWNEFYSRFKVLEIINRLKNTEERKVDKDVFKLREQTILFYYFINFIDNQNISKNENTNLCMENSSNTFTKDFIESMGKYIIKLRNKAVSKNKYERIGQKPNPRNFVSYRVGKEFTDPILNNSKIIEKEIENDECKMKLSTKTGIYEFILPIKTK